MAELPNNRRLSKGEPIMLEFRGDVSNECKRYLLKQNALFAFLATLIPVTFLSVCFIIVYVVMDIFALWMLLLCEAVLLLALVLAFLSPYLYKNKAFANMLPKVIRISEEGNMTLNLKII
ncbi:MAG: hypothetical protein K2M95_04095, partial [Clostridiales bacterium]|nr:hypothetical protein [Clostridiales bacterium]